MSPLSRLHLVLIAVLLACFGVVPLAQSATPSELGRPHLQVLPRTASEAARIRSVIAPAQDFTSSEPFEANSGGAATVRARDTRDAFSQPSGNMPFERELDFKVGDGLFRKIWVSSPSSTLVSDGLGPVFNARACQSCHLKDGRGHPPAGPQDDATSIFLRVSVPSTADAPLTEIEAFLAGIGEHGARTRPDPVYGGQLQDRALAGQAAEYRFEVRYDERAVELSGGERASLRVPAYTAADLGYGPLAPGAMLSPRVAQQMIGLGLLEAIPASDILAHADPDDADGDGISGRAQKVWSFEHGRPMLGRFGHKAGAPTIREQSAAAFSGDMGISSPVFPSHFGDCTVAQEACRAAPDGGSGSPENTEIGAGGLDLVTFYARNLGVPARRDVDDAEVLHGKRVFYETGCTACHQPKYVTARLEDQPEQSFQLIWPYTDLLLHDMGPGLADNRPEETASGTEWRTAPLWGTGLTETVSGRQSFLHDGRARTLLEAVLWHGGEAQSQKQSVIDMPPPDRAALIRFLESL